MDTVVVTSKVPQGSVPGSLLFLLFRNDCRGPAISQPFLRGLRRSALFIGTRCSKQGYRTDVELGKEHWTEPQARESSLLSKRTEGTEMLVSTVFTYQMQRVM